MWIEVNTHASKQGLGEFASLNVFAFFDSFVPTYALVLEDVLEA